MHVHHPKLYLEARDAIQKKSASSKATEPNRDVGQPSISEVMERSQAYERKGRRWKELTDSVTQCIAKDCLPIQTVNKPGFKKMLNVFDARYTLPSRNYFSHTALPTLYSSVRQKVTEELHQVNYYAATTDMWSSADSQPFISYTVHFIDDNWHLLSRCLQTHYLPADHTGEVIADAMEATLKAWDLTAAKQVCLTTDNGANIVNAARRLSWP